MAVIRRVLFTESSPNLGGQELQLLQQMVALQARGIETRLACRPASRIAQVATERGLPVIPVAFRNSLHLPSMLTLVRLLRAWSPEVIISHSGHDANNAALAARLTLRPRPRLVRSRTYLPGRPSAWSYNTLTDLTLTPSEEIRSQLLANPLIRIERVRVLYPGIDIARLVQEATLPLPAALTAWLEAHPGPLLVHAAMLRHEKGHAVMLAALAQLKREFPTVRYVIAGEGELRGALEARVCEHGLQEHVLFAGLVPHIAALYRRADLVVMPSLVEPLGMSQSEALALGVPVVASHVGGIPETLTDNRTGLLVAPGNVDDWVISLRRALKQPETMQRMALAGREVVHARFSLEANTEQLLAHLHSLFRS
ncbi:MAG: glycosyltransferase family 4 protein [Sterolibacterium sp.]|jgi:glycosyltransferase involved in cell wall biosynthesis|nr:glycosyltransferase family 4 protein [Sterolibacterium sp.]